jgi:hypothetical protein
MIDTDRMIRLMIETVLNLEHGERTAEEEAFVERVEAELAAARREWPGLPAADVPGENRDEDV